MHIDSISKEDWEQVAEVTHKVVFGEKRPASMDRVDYVLIASEGDLPLGYITVHELDYHNAYWQFGGAFPSMAKTSKVWECYQEAIEWSRRAQYKNIHTYINNQNVVMLKFAMKAGFRIIGVRLVDANILVELRLFLGGSK